MSILHTQVKSSNGIALVPLETRLFSDRRIFIEGEIRHETACAFAKQVMLLTAEAPSKPIDLWINSPGGEINSGLMIYDILQSSVAPIRVFCMGRAYSMAAVLVACGQHGRYLLPHSELMLHEPLLGNQVAGNSSSVRSISDSLLEAKRKMNEILAKHTGRTVEEIDRETGFDHYFSAQEAVDFGLVDGIASFDEMIGGNNHGR